MFSTSQLVAIATRAGCTPATVTRYIALVPMKPIVAKRIAAAARELGFSLPIHPNAADAELSAICSVPGLAAISNLSGGHL